MDFTIEYTKRHQKIYKENPEFITTFIVESQGTNREYDSWEKALKFIGKNKKIKKNILIRVSYEDKYVIDKNKKVAKNKLCEILLRTIDGLEENKVEVYKLLGYSVFLSIFCKYGILKNYYDHPDKDFFTKTAIDETKKLYVKKHFIKIGKMCDEGSNNRDILKYLRNNKAINF